MGIPLSCSCGRSLRVKDKLAGRRVKCPSCGGALTVPQKDPEDLAYGLVSDGAPPPPPAPEPELIPMRESPPPPAPAPYARPMMPVRRPLTEPEPRSPTPRVVFEEGWFGSMNSGVIGGLLMMLIAVVWFVGGLAVGYIFFYPPILFVIGFVALLKGMAGGD